MSSDKEAEKNAALAKQSWEVSAVCDQCGMAPTITVVKWQGHFTPLCLKCWKEFNSIMGDLHERNVREMNHLSAMMDATTGMPSGFTPRYELPAPKYQTLIGDLTLHKIKIEKSAVGVLNTGTISGSLENIDASIQIGAQDPSLTQAINAVKQFTEAVVNTVDASVSQKQELLELLSALAEELRTTKDRRRVSVIKSVAMSIAAVAGGIVSVAEAWELVKPMLQSLLP